MRRSLNHNLTILAVSAALGVAVGMLIAPRRGKDLRQSLKHGLGRFYHYPAQGQDTVLVGETAPETHRLAEIGGPYQHS